MVLTAVLRAFPSIFHGAALRLMGKTLVLTLLLFALLAAALWAGFHGVRLHFGWGGGMYAEATATVLIVIAAGWLLFRAMAMAVMGLFADDIVEAVERNDYPHAAARPVGWARSLRFALASLGRTIGWNLIALPAYVLLLVTGVGTIGLFLAINAYLLGRDMADMVEPRHPALPPLSRGGRWLMGLVSALLFLVPLVNLLAPIFSAAMAVHMLLGRKKTI
ncbi:EI24 domain-containing protein [Sphingobium sp. BYY-5]|uniref:EI24 domain-containing protein n=1 Tax=Sphingobium sp. BYY-5 TaxID=2926400 RepID=UPI001FA7D373|nr:EI24 domain-containing protein [Sphingobium sp. BYY-5]MCI4590650.1 EI24 domain-containing protein [Sphingobium sp. BYY-5]